jgi:hypothetical protein
MTSGLIEVVIHSFKNKKLKDIIDNIISTSNTDISIRIIDQNPVNRSSVYNSYPQVTYRYVSWDSIHPTTAYRCEAVTETRAKYLLLMSDDIVLSNGWDSYLLNVVQDRVISGCGTASVYHKDKFFLGVRRGTSPSMSLTNYVDKNFIFGATMTLRRINYPEQVKYFGEEELLSIALYLSGVDVYSLPTGFYSDLNNRTFENMYTTMSLEHRYDLVVDAIKTEDHLSYLSKNIVRSKKDFIELHGIDKDKINKLPFQKNDVSYDPDKIEFLRTTPKKFVDTTKIIS